MMHAPITRAGLVGLLLVLSGCTSSSSTSTSTMLMTGTSGVTSTATPAATADDVAAAFASAYAGGDTPSACKLASGSALSKLTDHGMCAGRATWSETPRLVDSCAQSAGERHYEYRTDREVDRDLQFDVSVSKTSATSWQVDYFGGRASTDNSALCDVSSSTTSGG